VDEIIFFLQAFKIFIERDTEIFKTILETLNDDEKNQLEIIQKEGAKRNF